MVNGLNTSALKALGVSEEKVAKIVGSNMANEAIQIMMDCGLSDEQIESVMPDGQPSAAELIAIVKRKASRVSDATEYMGKEIAEDWTFKFLDADLKLHTVKCKDWSTPVPSKEEGIDINPCTLPTGDLGIMFFTHGSYHPLGYITRKNGVLEKHFSFLSTERDYLFRLYRHGEHVGDICNHSVKQLRAVKFDVGESYHSPHTADDLDFTEVYNGEVQDMISNAATHNEQFQALSKELDAYYEGVTSEEGHKRCMELQDERDYMWANMPLNQTHKGCEVKCASLKFNKNDEPFDLPNEYRIGTEVFEQDVYVAYPEIKNLIDAASNTDGDISEVFLCMCSEECDFITTFLDANLESHSFRESKGSEPEHVPNADIDAALCKDLDDRDIIVFYEPVAWLTRATAFRANDQWFINYGYIQDISQYLLGVGKNGGYSRIICNATVDKLREAQDTLHATVHHDWDSLEFVDYRTVQYDELVRGNGRPSPFGVVKHSEDDGITLEDVEPMAIIPNWDVPLAPEYKIGEATFEQDVFKAYPGLKAIIEKLRTMTCSTAEAYNTIMGINSSNTAGNITKEDLMHNSSWIMPLMLKGIDPEQWFEQNFPNGASSEHDIDVAITKATT